MGKNYRLPGQTCPDIDLMIKNLKALEGEELDRSDVNNLVDQLEDLRLSNSQLRGIAHEAIDEVAEVEQRIGELEDELQVAESKIQCLEADQSELSAKIKDLESLLEKSPEPSFVQWREGRGQDEGYFVSDGKPVDLRKYFPSMRHG